MLEKKIELGLITILQDGIMQVREDTVIYEDGVEISRTYNRYVSNPGDDLEGKPQRVRNIANLIWTPEVIEAFKEKLRLAALKLPDIPSEITPVLPSTILMPPANLIKEN